jgi:predicted translin family RNA/ssDNA-binding protein
MADKTITQAAAENDQAALMAAVRERLENAVKDGDTPARDLASLTKQLLEIAREIVDKVDKRAVLSMMQTRIAATVQSLDTHTRELAALTKRLMEVTSEIAAIDVKDDTSEGTVEAAAQTPDEPFDGTSI